RRRARVERVSPRGEGVQGVEWTWGWPRCEGYALGHRRRVQRFRSANHTAKTVGRAKARLRAVPTRKGPTWARFALLTLTDFMDDLLEFDLAQSVDPVYCSWNNFARRLS